MSQPQNPPTSGALPRAPLVAVIVAWTLALIAGSATIYQHRAVHDLRADNDLLTAQHDATQKNLQAAMRYSNSLAEQLAAHDPQETARLERAVTALEDALAAAEADRDAVQAELASARAALEAQEAEIAALSANILPPPPTVDVLAPPPLYASADFGDPHVDADLDQYLTELLRILSDDRNAPQLARIHPLGILYELERDLLLQGTVGATQRYRVTEWHTLNEYKDIVLASLVIIDAPPGTHAATRAQQALTSTRGHAETNEDGNLTWEVGNKSITLHPDPTDATRVTLHISDSYQLPNVMQVYNRQ